VRTARRDAVTAGTRRNTPAGHIWSRTMVHQLRDSADEQQNYECDCGEYPPTDCRWALHIRVELRHLASLYSGTPA
jgi:hypothetical protein